MTAELATTEDYLPDLSDLRAAARRGPGEALVLSVGGIRTSLEGLEKAQLEMARHRYGVFSCGSEAASGAEMQVQVGRSERPGFLKVQPDPAGPEYYRIDIRWEGNVLQATSYEWAGWVDPEAGQGGLILSRALDSDRTAFHRSTENFLRVVYSHLVATRGGFLLHAAGLVRRGRAYLFFGPSGAGKTTVTRLTPEALILSDDLTLIMRSAEGGFNACSVPFRGVFAPHPASIEAFPVAGLFRLVQAAEDRVEPLEGARAVGEIVASLPFVTDRQEGVDRVLDVVSEVVSKVSVAKLHFRKDRTFWREIERSSLKFDDFSPDRGIKT